jgi:GntR family transcriptional regulator
VAVTVQDEAGRGVPGPDRDLLRGGASGDRPVYRQIADQLREAIRGGRYPEGSLLPSETALADTYGVTRMTARQAVEVLKSEGLVRSEHGRGMFVRQRPTIRRLAATGSAALTGRPARAPMTWR